MGIRLYPPGTRKGNKTYVARISHDGGRYEIRTHAANEGGARRDAQAFLVALGQRRADAGTVGAAIDAYLAFRRPAKADRRYLDRLRAWFGRRRLAGLGQADFDQAAAALYPGRANETWNRQVYTPLQAALRHAGVRLDIRRPRMKKPRHRALTAADRDLLFANAGDADLRAYLALMFYNGARSSEAVALTRDRVDFESMLVCFDASKTGEDSWRPLHPVTAAALANLPRRAGQAGRFLRWSTRSGPRKPVERLREATGIHFTPHTGRHTFADLLMEYGASLRDLMDAGNWSTTSAAMRYTARRVERTRKAINRL